MKTGLTKGEGDLDEIFNYLHKMHLPEEPTILKMMFSVYEMGVDRGLELAKELKNEDSGRK